MLLRHIDNDVTTKILAGSSLRRQKTTSDDLATPSHSHRRGTCSVLLDQTSQHLEFLEQGRYRNAYIAGGRCIKETVFARLHQLMNKS